MNETNLPRILSLMEKHMGHGTYGNLLRKEFQKSATTQVDFYWYYEERSLDAKILRKLLSLSVGDRRIQKQNLDFFRLRAQLSYAYMARQLAFKKISYKNYSALHFHTYILAFLSMDLLKKIPTVVSLDMTTSLAAQEQTDPNFQWTYAPNLYLGKQVFENAAKIVTRSQWARKSVIKDYNIHPEKVKVIYPGVDITKLTPPINKNPQKPFNILFVGNDFDRKGGNDLLNVFLKLFYKEAELHLVTHAPIKGDYPNVYIHNNIKAYTPQWLDLYHQADVFVMPTHFEGFGWVFIEAMAAGLPVIATNINAIPEIVVHGETGFLIEKGDRNDLACKLRVLMENPALAKEMGMKGREIVEKKFNAQIHCQILENLFYDVTYQ
jgi:glycosyltransferase involved in cell wall biosynthesis